MNLQKLRSILQVCVSAKYAELKKGLTITYSMSSEVQLKVASCVKLSLKVMKSLIQVIFISMFIL